MKIGRKFIHYHVADCFALVGIHWVKITKTQAYDLLNSIDVIAETDYEIKDADCFDRTNLYLFYKHDEQTILDTTQIMPKTKHKRPIQYSIPSEYDLIKKKALEIEKDGRTIKAKFSNTNKIA